MSDGSVTSYDMWRVAMLAARAASSARGRIAIFFEKNRLYVKFSFIPHVTCEENISHGKYLDTR